jgi:hypothetical protein
MSAAIDDRPWISLMQAARILSRGPGSTGRILDLAGVRRQDLPGSRTRWSAADVRELAERSVRRPGPASAITTQPQGDCIP